MKFKTIGQLLAVAHFVFVMSTCQLLVAQSEWEFVTSPPGNEAFLWDVDGSSPNDVWAVGVERIYYAPFSYDEFSLALHWNGNQWNQIQTPSPAWFNGNGGTSVSLYDVVSIGPDDVWAVGTYQTQHPDGFVGFQTIAIHFNGSEWSVVPTPFTPAGMSGSSLNSVVAIDSNNVFAAGHIVDPIPGDMVDWTGFALHWDGTEWTALPQPPIPGLRSQFDDMAVIDENNLIMIGGHSGQNTGARDQPFVAIWNGDWELVDVPVPPGQNFLESVTVISPDDIWIAGTNDQTGEGYQPLLIHFDGISWEVFSNVEFEHYGGSLRGLTAFSSDRIYASGSFAPNHGDFNHPLLMQYDGVAWRQVPTDPAGPVGGSLFSMDEVGSEIWAVGIQNATMSHTQRLVTISPLLGDVNDDGEVNLLDVQPFVSLVANGEFQVEADINQDGIIDLLDVDGFVAILIG